MGCFSSKSLEKYESFREDELKLLQNKAANNGYEEIQIPKPEADQLLAIFCRSKQSSPTCNAESRGRLSNSAAAPARGDDGLEGKRKKMETIDARELMAGLEDEVEEGHSKSSSSSAGSSKREEHVKKESATEEREKGWRRKAMARELAARKGPAMELIRTGSLRDWLLQGGQASAADSRRGEGKEEEEEEEEEEEIHEDDAFDPELIAQLEKAMEEMTLEEEEILRQIVENWDERGLQGSLLKKEKHNDITPLP
ncbi:hypothetical protein AXF42_Ash010665 [Apostasia shenzhenica]|uniref:Uncharacterized protein n=1 Tax=Apostasia shenzhenica TaxID=1088818 RepID=A0A2I0A6S7_9ASPA|nr:hypothetical protein AXF42_Ash010665 [Apostasia shenzhenica]